MIRKVLMVSCLGLSVAAWGWAQEAGGGAAGGGGNTGGNTGGGNTGGGAPGGANPGGNTGGQNRGNQTQDPFGQRQRQDQLQQMQINRPIFLSGQVQLSNGSPPPESVVIERVCAGQTRPEGYTDSKGRFSFEVGGSQSAALMDASYSGGMGQDGRGGGFGPLGGNGMPVDSMGGVDMSGCELRASLPGFRSDLLMLGRRRPMDNPDVGVIVLHPLDGFIGSAISATTLTAPKKAKSAYDKGVREMRKGEPKYDKAAEQFETAVELHPEFAAAWTMLAEVRILLEDADGAEAALTKSIEADPAYIRPYEPLVKLAAQKQDWNRVDELAAATLRLHPGQTQIRYLGAIAAYNLGRIDEAERAAREISTGSDAQAFPHAHQMMGMIYSQKGSYPQAANAFRTYLQLAPTAPSGEQIRKQLNEWEALGVIEPLAQAEAAAK